MSKCSRGRLRAPDRCQIVGSLFLFLFVALPMVHAAVGSDEGQGPVAEVLKMQPK